MLLLLSLMKKQAMLVNQLRLDIKFEEVGFVGDYFDLNKKNQIYFTHSNHLTESIGALIILRHGK
jgi:hypothetical protein